jgi:HD superfamily phosphodiesterase
MNRKINQIKKLVKSECVANGLGWFYDCHLLAVEKFAQELLEKLPEADKEIVMLGVWLHDLQRVRGIKGDHAKIGASEAEKVLEQFKYSQETIARVEEIILAHSCDTRLMPKTREGKILASADAMSHYINDFYLTIAATGQRDAASFKKWAREKLERDYHKKIFFGFARKMVAKRHKILKEFFAME